MATSNTNELLRLIAENPDLPVVPMVDYEVVYEGYGRWLGSFGAACVGEYALFGERYYEDREEFKEQYFSYHEEELCERFNYDPVHDGINEALEKYLDEVADKYFVKAILVNIGLPDVEEADNG